MKLTYATYTESIDEKLDSISLEQTDKLLLEIAKRMYEDGDIVFSEKEEEEKVITEATVRYYKIQD